MKKVSVFLCVGLLAVAAYAAWQDGVKEATASAGGSAITIVADDVYRLQENSTWDTGTGPSANNIWSLEEYASLGATNNELNGAAVVSLETTLQSAYITFNCDAPSWAQSVDWAKLSVRATSTNPTVCYVTNVLITCDEGAWTNAVEYRATTADEFATYSLTLPTSLQTTGAGSTSYGDVTNSGFQIRCEVYSSNTNYIQPQINIRWNSGA